MTARTDPAMRAMLVARLRERRAAGELTTAEVQSVARLVGISETTVWRWLRDDPPDTPPPQAESVRRYRLTEADRDAYADWRGNVAGMWRARQTAGEAGLPPLRTLQKAFARGAAVAADGRGERGPCRSERCGCQELWAPHATCWYSWSGPARRLRRWMVFAALVVGWGVGRGEGLPPELGA